MILLWYLASYENSLVEPSLSNREENNNESLIHMSRPPSQYSTQTLADGKPIWWRKAPASPSSTRYTDHDPFRLPAVSPLWSAFPIPASRRSPSRLSQFALPRWRYSYFQTSSKSCGSGATTSWIHSPSSPRCSRGSSGLLAGMARSLDGRRNPYISKVSLPIDPVEHGEVLPKICNSHV